MGYSIRTSNYPEKITRSDLIHMMSIDDPIPIGVEELRIDSECYLEIEFIVLICMNP